jgi:hypothetical protein
LQYYSDTKPEVKRRILATMQQWNYSLMDQGKVREAYQMLLRQGVEFPEDVEMPVLEVSLRRLLLQGLFSVFFSTSRELHAGQTPSVWHLHVAPRVTLPTYDRMQ